MRILQNIILLLALPCSIANSAEISDRDIPYAWTSAHALGRGHTGIAIADYEDALFYNPGGLALFERRPLDKSVITRFRTFEENINGTPQNEGIYKRLILASPMFESSESIREPYEERLEADANPLTITESVLGENIHLGLNQFTGLCLRNISFGVFSSGQADAIVSKDPEFGGLETARAKVQAYSGIAIGYGLQLHDYVMTGATVRIQKKGAANITVEPTQSIATIRENLSNNDALQTGSGFGLDLGMMTRSPMRVINGIKTRFHGGIQIKDIGNTKHDDIEMLEDPQTINLGLAADSIQYNMLIRLLVDVYDLANSMSEIPFYQKVKYGMELWFNPNTGIQGGFSDSYLSYGLFLDFTLVRLDAGVYTEETGYKQKARPDKRGFVRLTVGF